MAEDYAGKYYGRASFVDRLAAEDLDLMGFIPLWLGIRSTRLRSSGFPTFYQAARFVGTGYMYFPYGQGR
jgi:hypothetical protein